MTKGNYFKVGECPCEITFKDVVEKDTFSDTSSSEEEQKPNEVRQHEEKSSESEQSPRKKHSQKHRYNKNKYKREKEKEKEEHDDSNDSPRTRLLKKKKTFLKSSNDLKATENNLIIKERERSRSREDSKDRERGEKGRNRLENKLQKEREQIKQKWDTQNSFSSQQNYKFMKLMGGYKGLDNTEMEKQNDEVKRIDTNAITRYSQINEDLENRYKTA